MKKIVIEFDNVLNDLASCWTRELEWQLKCAPTYRQKSAFTADMAMEDIFTGWPYHDIYWPYYDGTIYYDISPLKDSQDVIKTLWHNYDIYVHANLMLTTDMIQFKRFVEDGNNPKLMTFLFRYLWSYFPCIKTENVIISKDKPKLFDWYIYHKFSESEIEELGGNYILYTTKDNNPDILGYDKVSKAINWKQVLEIIEDDN